MSEPQEPIDCDPMLASPFTNEVRSVTIGSDGKYELKCRGDCQQCQCGRENQE